MMRSGRLSTLFLASLSTSLAVPQLLAAVAATAVPSSSSSFTSSSSPSSYPTSPGADDAVDAYISIGSNVGDRVQAFRDALRHLRRLGEVRRTSFLYETAPMYVTDQATFLNAACLLRTSLSPELLLRELKAIEAAVVRKQSFRNGPRLIDVDIILYGNRTVCTEDLEVTRDEALPKDIQAKHPIITMSLPLVPLSSPLSSPNIGPRCSPPSESP